MRRCVQSLIAGLGLLAGVGGPERPLLAQEPPTPRPGATCSEEERAALLPSLRRQSPDSELRLCAPGRFPALGYIVLVASRGGLRQGILGAGGQGTRGPLSELPRAPLATSLVELAAVDLDGDGVDEIIEVWRRSAHGKMGSDNWLVARRVTDTGLGPRLPGPHLSIYFPDLGHCRARWSVATPAIVVHVEEASRLTPSDCLALGTHRFVLRGERLVEQN